MIHNRQYIVGKSGPFVAHHQHHPAVEAKGVQVFGTGRLLQADELVEESRQKALEREQRAEAQIRQEQAQAMAQVRDQAAQLSVQFAERVLRDGLKEEHQQELLEAAIRDVEELAQRESQ